MSEQWPWTGESLNVWELLERNWTYAPERREQKWKLTNYPEGCEEMGNGSKVWNCSGNDPYSGIPGIQEMWVNATQGGFAPEGLFWICGNHAYTKLPRSWKGVCFLGFIRPEFFLLPQDGIGELELGVKVFDSLNREKRDLKVGEWGNDWPPGSHY